MKQYLLISIFILFLTTSCSDNERKKDFQDYKKKEQQLPEKAFWIESELGEGYWINVLSIHSHKNIAYLEIYDAKSKQLITSKKFVLYCGLNPNEDEIEWIDDLEKQISEYTGRKLFFKDSDCYLI
ncbi:hypothetical protein ACFS5M_12360 [Lacinutrix iliipiscaria]|uniref:Lipoprotein n=1 Tax=Lacinutrix iliipiscaria TaxID=1230532 RepID=A0ABW5WSQ7_9FLAO